MNLLNNFYLIS